MFICLGKLMFEASHACALQVTMSLTCGGIAGLISSTATFPLDLIRRRMQLEGQGGIRRYRGYADVARAVFASGGFRGFYAGIIPEYYKVQPCPNLLPQSPSQMRRAVTHCCLWVPSSTLRVTKRQALAKV